MSTWWKTVEQALINLGSEAPLKDIYTETRAIRKELKLSTPKSLEAVVRKELEYNSSDSSNWNRNRDIFYSAKGLGAGVWGLRTSGENTPKALDMNAPETGSNEFPELRMSTIYRILRDTALARKLKSVHDHRCQICSETIQLSNGRNYSEAHHIIPLGKPHRGPDIAENIIVVCPNHHAMLDYGAIILDAEAIRAASSHRIGPQYIRYHNDMIWVADQRTVKR